MVMVDFLAQCAFLVLSWLDSGLPLLTTLPTSITRSYHTINELTKTPYWTHQDFIAISCISPKERGSATDQDSGKLSKPLDLVLVAINADIKPSGIKFLDRPYAIFHYLRIWQATNTSLAHRWVFLLNLQKIDGQPWGKGGSAPLRSFWMVTSHDWMRRSHGLAPPLHQSKNLTSHIGLQVSREGC